jgi:hypothetical protein
MLRALSASNCATLSPPDEQIPPVLSEAPKAQHFLNRPQVAVLCVEPIVCVLAPLLGGHVPSVWPNIVALRV